MAGKGKPKTGGRKAGTPNKDAQDLFAICEKHNVNVFESMVMLAAQSHAAGHYEDAFNRFKELAPYLYAKRKDLNVGIDPEKNEIIIRVMDYGAKS